MILGISTFSERSYISRMIENGASGYLIKSASKEEIAEAIETVMKGRMYLSVSMEHLMRPAMLTPTDALPALTKREKEILEYLIKGYSNVMISKQLGISYETAKWHCKRIIGKLGVKNRKEIKKSNGVVYLVE